MSLKDSAPKVYAKLRKNYQSYGQCVPDDKSLIYEGVPGLFSQKTTPNASSAKGKIGKERDMKRFRHFDRLDQIQIKTQQIAEKLNLSQSK